MAGRIKFHQSLDDLKEHLLVMAGMAEQAIQRSIKSRAAGAEGNENSHGNGDAELTMDRERLHRLLRDAQS